MKDNSKSENLGDLKKIKKNNYMDDEDLTKLLIKEINDVKEKVKKTPSDDLTKKFLIIHKHIVSRSNFSGYSDDYKVEFLSKAQMKFIRNWYKFKPEKSKHNFNSVDTGSVSGIKNELKGAFNFFSLISWTSITDEIKKLNKQKSNQEKFLDIYRENNKSCFNQDNQENNFFQEQP